MQDRLIWHKPEQVSSRSTNWRICSRWCSAMTGDDGDATIKVRHELHGCANRSTGIGMKLQSYPNRSITKSGGCFFLGMHAEADDQGPCQTVDEEEIHGYGSILNE